MGYFGGANWRSDAPVDEWPGVTTDDNGRVTELIMEDLDIRSVRPLVGFFTVLRVLDLSGNKLERLPPELGLLTELTVLDLSDNALVSIEGQSESYHQDSIPFLGMLTNLKVLDLGGNRRLGGCLPDVLRNQLDMSKSDLGGLQFCTEQASAQSLREKQQQARLDSERQVLVALYNATGGDDWWDKAHWLSDEPVGEWFGVTTNNGFVTGLKLYENNLTGRIPTTLENFSELNTLHIFGNRLSGCIPNGLQAQLTDVQLGGLGYCP